MPHAVGIIEPRGIADRSGISVRRINADTESKAGAVISSAAVIGATAIRIPAIEVSADVSACRRGERVTATKVSAARCGKGVSSAKSACVSSFMSASAMSASATGSERPYRAYGHRNDESSRSEYLSNQVQKSLFHDDLQRPS